MYTYFASLLSFLAFSHLGIASLLVKDAVLSGDYFNRTLFRRVRTGNGGLPETQTVQNLFTIGSGNPSVCK